MKFLAYIQTYMQTDMYHNAIPNKIQMEINELIETREKIQNTFN